MTNRNLMMIIAFAAIAPPAIGLSSSSARADQYPVLNVQPLCQGIIKQSSLQDGLRTVTLEECLKAEQEDGTGLGVVTRVSSNRVISQDHRAATAVEGFMTDTVLWFGPAYELHPIGLLATSPSDETAAIRHATSALQLARK